MALTEKEAHHIAVTFAVESFRSRAMIGSHFDGSRNDIEMACRRALGVYDQIIASIVTEEEP